MDSLPELISDREFTQARLDAIYQHLQDAIVRTAARGIPIKFGSLGIHRHSRSGPFVQDLEQAGLCAVGALMLDVVPLFGCQEMSWGASPFIEAKYILGVDKAFISGLVYGFDHGMMPHCWTDFSAIAGLGVGARLHAFVESGQHLPQPVTDWPTKRMLPVPVGEAVYVEADV